MDLVDSVDPRDGSEGSLVRADETIEHPLAAGVLEVDLQLVAFDSGDGAIAELGMEHPLAKRQVVTALVAQAHRRGLRFNDSLGLGVEAAAR